MDEKAVLSFLSDFNEIEQEISKAIIGQKNIIRNVLIAMIAGGNVLLEGLPGLGKTQLVKSVGRVLDLKFSRIQFTPDLMPADVTGTNIMEKDSGVRFSEGPIFSNIVLADEINRATPKTQSALLEAMQEQTVTSGNVTYELPKPFFVLATQNPLELEGTYPLPEAQLDRFMFKLKVDFPSRDELLKIVGMTTAKDELSLEKKGDANKLLEMRNAAMQVPVAEAVLKYAMDIVIKSHPENESSPENIKKYVRYGSSPRGAQAIITAARINALLNERFNAAYDDIHAVAPYALGHRMFLNFDAISDGVSVEDLIKLLLDEGVK